MALKVVSLRSSPNAPTSKRTRPHPNRGWIFSKSASYGMVDGPVGPSPATAGSGWLAGCTFSPEHGVWLAPQRDENGTANKLAYNFRFKLAPIAT